ncbi:hypothetical protein D9757_010280 [Collybiopsis confluens]|uniref:Uncharacterized protein n=1 Tax=Collybiopsis confluens TaxID=2823264 RepID=A0A8H5HB03_9AGAR|nr:hypothetical protein D9757_010280 [Collybiopsis confluens]
MTIFLVETHMFWNHAIALIDPHDIMAAHAWIRNNNSSAPPVRISPFHHFRNITLFSCTVCQVNAPYSMQGSGNARRAIFNPYLGYSGICREHDKRPVAYCGLCFRERQSSEAEHQMSPYLIAGCLENEDLDTWPKVEATCKSCRSEWLWRSASSQSIEEAVGGRKFCIDDWEARNTVDNFVEMAEGRISNVLMIARERHWIRGHTKLVDMLSQAMAASCFDGREERLMGDAEMDLSEAEDDEDDYELAQLTEDGGIRDLALGDWARNRILDGFWISPGDQWWGNVQSDHPFETVHAVHPCPWAVEEEASVEGEKISAVDEEHPKLTTVSEIIPPSHPLCEQTFRAFQKQMRIVLLPAMRNIVRRLVIECGADGVNPAILAARMNPEDIMRELRDEVIWFDGVDWLERRRNARREHAARDEASSDDHSTPSSSGSTKSSDESLTATNPVLPSTTIQTTPSPPPQSEREDKNDINSPQEAKSVTIAVSPVLNPPRLIHPIPHVPVMAAHLPSFSLEAFKLASYTSFCRVSSNVWQEACSPLYQCRCKICERAQAEANATAALAAGVIDLRVSPDVVRQSTPTDLVDIKLNDGTQTAGAEEGADYVDYDDDEEDFDSEFEHEEVEDRYISRLRSRSPPRVNRPIVYKSQSPLTRRITPPTLTLHPLPHSEPQVSPRKRSCDEIEDGRIYGRSTRDDGSEAGESPKDIVDFPRTLPKRIRTEGPETNGLDGHALQLDDPSERMLRKRSSEMMDSDVDSHEGEGTEADLTSRSHCLWSPHLS